MKQEDNVNSVPTRAEQTVAAVVIFAGLLAVTLNSVLAAVVLYGDLFIRLGGFICSFDDT